LLQSALELIDRGGALQANVISDVGQEYCYKGIIRQISSIAS
jgi:hypothetical protein